ncbi:hypothetical protein N7478_013241 [Penicillium angulare]|uniref:uncharacterized protein n=1 Tax=Penicillium angulare TaxID=116970 RepID=UPI00253FB296|nr:uncharacterized protein N7478_013241 [Penicillium angulare]KAJ5257137.1 hypothetical protein N7478_013241 [Penicillium angulare]
MPISDFRHDWIDFIDRNTKPKMDAMYTWVTILGGTKCGLALVIIRQISGRVERWWLVFPVLAIVASIIEFLFHFFPDGRREIKPWLFWSMRLIDCSSLGGAVALLILEHYVGHGTYMSLIASFLALTALEFTVHTFWAMWFERASWLRAYAPICMASAPLSSHGQLLSASTGPLAQLYGLTQGPQQSTRVMPTQTDSGEGIGLPADDVSTEVFLDFPVPVARDT